MIIHLNQGSRLSQAKRLLVRVTHISHWSAWTLSIGSSVCSSWAALCWGSPFAFLLRISVSILLSTWESLMEALSARHWICLYLWEIEGPHWWWDMWNTSVQPLFWTAEPHMGMRWAEGLIGVNFYPEKAPEAKKIIHVTYNYNGGSLIGLLNSTGF